MGREGLPAVLALAGLLAAFSPAAAVADPAPAATTPAATTPRVTVPSRASAPPAKAIPPVGHSGGVGPGGAGAPAGRGAPAPEEGEAAEPEAIPPRMETAFYGWPILGIGEGAALVTSAALVLPNTPVESTGATFAFVLGAPTYLFAGPVMHWTHGHFAKGLISFGGNVALPLLTGAIGRALSCGDADADSNCGSRAFGRSVAVGLLVAPLLDGLLLGWEEVPTDYIGREGGPRSSDAGALTRPWAPTISPYLGVGADGRPAAGVFGRF